MYSNIAKAVVNDSFRESPEELWSVGEIGRLTITGIAESDIILECRIDESTGDSGEIDTEERSSCGIGIELAGIGDDVAELERSGGRWSGCFVDHLCSPFRSEEAEAHIVTLPRPSARVTPRAGTDHGRTNPKPIPRPLGLKRKLNPEVKRQQVDKMDRVSHCGVDLLSGIP